MTVREQSLMLATLEMLRKEVSKSPDFREHDWKDVDDYIFSELDFTVEDLMNIYHGKNVYLYTGSAIEGFAPAGLTYDELYEVFEEMDDDNFGIELKEVDTIIGKKLAVATSEKHPRVLLTSGDTPELERLWGSPSHIWLKHTQTADGKETLTFYGKSLTQSVMEIFTIEKH